MTRAKPLDAEPPNEKGCVHLKLPVECVQTECGKGTVVTFHTPKGAENVCAVEAPEGFRVVPVDGQSYAFACEEHAVAWVRRRMVETLLAETLGRDGVFP